MSANWWKRWRLLVASALLPIAAWGADRTQGPGVPGTMNYVEGQVFLNGEKLGSKAIGSTTMDPGQSVSTEQGKAEVLLTPGVFLRVGDNSSVRMIDASLTNTEVDLETGQVLLEVAELHPENDLRVKEDGITTRIEKTGLYEFDLDAQVIRVFEGKAEVETESRHVTLKAGHELSTGDNERLVARKFDRKSYEQYGWMPGGPMWWGAGWYWDPWFDAFTYMPGDGIFFSPFGWGFYSPWCVYQAPFYGYGYGYGRGQFYHHFSTNTATWGPGGHYTTGTTYAKGLYNGPGTMKGAFHSGGRTVAGTHRSGIFGGRGSHGGGGFHSAGGFHGGGGGFHGGGSVGGHGH